MRRVAMAIAAHPDDIEFLMAGTLRLLTEAGWETHYMTVANGSCGSLTLGPAKIAAIRRKEARAALGLASTKASPPTARSSMACRCCAAWPQ
jgi:LmbE family N-acetylglucosaminyl deacetylase